MVMPLAYRLYTCGPLRNVGLSMTSFQCANSNICEGPYITGLIPMYIASELGARGVQNALTPGFS